MLSFIANNIIIRHLYIDIITRKYQYSTWHIDEIIFPQIFLMNYLLLFRLKMKSISALSDEFHAIGIAKENEHCSNPMWCGVKVGSFTCAFKMYLFFSLRPGFHSTFCNIVVEEGFRTATCVEEGFRTATCGGGRLQDCHMCGGRLQDCHMWWRKALGLPHVLD